MRKNTTRNQGEGCAFAIMFPIIVVVVGFAAWLFELGIIGALAMILVISGVAFSDTKIR